MQQQLYDVAIIIINYNSSRYTIDCVDSIIEKTSPAVKYLIVVVDNNSRAEDYIQLEQIGNMPQVKLFRSKVNLGFSAGNMMGVQFAAARYYYFLNNDCLFINDCLRILFEFCEQHPNVALCSGQMYDEKMDPQVTFVYFPTLSSKLLGTGFMRLFYPSRFPKRKSTYTQPLKVDLVSGSSMFVRSAVFEEIGGFDTTYFFYCEEEDIALRIYGKKYDTYLVPEARFQHLGGKSTHRNLLIEKEFYISFLYLYRKHYGRFKTILMQVFLFFKLARKTFRHRNFMILAFFVLSGAPLYKSLRHQQKISSALSKA